MRTRTPLARRFIAALLMVALTACVTWQPTTVSPQQLIPAEQPSSVRVTLTSGETRTVRDPTMRNDSIVGITKSGVIGVVARDVRLLEVPRFNVENTIGLGVFLMTAIVHFASCAPFCHQ